MLLVKGLELFLSFKHPNDPLKNTNMILRIIIAHESLLSFEEA